MCTQKLGSKSLMASDWWIRSGPSLNSFYIKRRQVKYCENNFKVVHLYCLILKLNCRDSVIFSHFMGKDSAAAELNDIRTSCLFCLLQKVKFFLVTFYAEGLSFRKRSAVLGLNLLGEKYPQTS